MNLWWHFRWAKRLMQSMLVQHPDWLRSPGRLSESALNLLHLSVQLKKSSKSMPAHNVDNTEATVLSHKYRLIIYVVAGPIQLIYAPPLLLAADCTHENILYSCKSGKRVTGPTWHVRQPAQGPYSLGSWARTPPRAQNGEEAIHKDTGKTDHDSGKGCKYRDLVPIQIFFVGENPCDE